VKKILIVLIVLASVCAGVFFMVIKGLDVENYKKQFLDSIQELTGRQAQINGDLSLTWSPTPTITITDVQIENINGASQPFMVKIDKVNAVVEWDSLFKNPLVFKKVILDKPVIYLEQLADKQVNWDFEFLNSSSLDEIDLLGERRQSLSPKFESMIIIDGQIIYQSAVYQVHKNIDNINGELIADSVQGPFKFDGSFEWDAKKISTMLTTDKIASDRATEMNFLMTTNGENAAVRFKGILSRLSTGSSLSGGLSLRVKNLARFFKDFNVQTEIPESFETPLIGNVSLELSPTVLDLKEIALRQGAQETTNALSGSLKYVFLPQEKEEKSLNGTFIMDRIEAAGFVELAKNYFDKKGWSGFAPTSFTSSSFNLNIKEILYNKQSIKDTLLTISTQKNGFVISKFSAKAPYDTQFDVSGQVVFEQNTPKALLKANLTSADIRNVLIWLDEDKLASFPQGTFKKTVFNGDAEISPSLYTFKKSSLQIDNVKAQGNLTVQTGEKPTVNAFMTLQNINLDTYYPPKKNVQKGKETGKEKQSNVQPLISFAELPTLFRDGLKKLSFFNTTYIKAEISAENITYQNLPIKSASLNFSSANGSVLLNLLKVDDMASLSFRLDGALEGFGNKPLNIQNLNYTVSLKNAELFMNRAGIKNPFDSPNVLNDADSSGSLKGNEQLLEISTTTEFAQVSLTGKGSIQNVFTTPSYNLDISVKHPNFHTFAGLFNPDFNYLPALAGSFKWSSSVSGTKDSLNFGNLEATIGIQTLKGDLAYKSNPLTIEGSLQASILDLDKFIQPNSLFSTKENGFSKEAFDFNLWKNLSLNLNISAQLLSFKGYSFDNVKTLFSLKDKTFRLIDFTGNILKGEIEANGSLNIETGSWKNSLVLKNIDTSSLQIKAGPFILTKGTLSLKGDTESKGSSFYELAQNAQGFYEYSLVQPTIKGLSFSKIEREIRDISDKPENADQKLFEDALKKDLYEGSSILNSMKGKIDLTKGVLSLTNNNFFATQANGLFNFRLNLSSWTEDGIISVQMTSLKNLPVFSLALKGNIQKPEYSQNTEAFTTYINTLITKAQQTLLQKKVNETKKKQTDDNKNRKKMISDLKEKADNLEKSIQALIKNSPESDAKLSFESLKEALSLLNEVNAKEFVSMLDVRKAEQFFERIELKAKEAQNFTIQKILSIGRDSFAHILEQSTDYMTKITTVYNSLKNVEEIESVYRESSSAHKMLEQNQEIVNKTTEIEQMDKLLSSSQKLYQIILSAYKKVERFDPTAVIAEGKKETEDTKVEGIIAPRSRSKK
jgi:uncharacterized protein involved in outer membrane biogenesis